MVGAQAAQGVVERLVDFFRQAMLVSGHDLHLGGDQNFMAPPLEGAAQIFFGAAPAIVGRGVEIIHPRADGLGDGFTLVGHAAQNHQTGVVTGAKTQHRGAQAGVANGSLGQACGVAHGLACHWTLSGG